MKDGKEGTGYTASNEKVTGLNPTIIQSKKWADQEAADGVQKTAKNLFNNTDATAPIYVIPTGDDMSVTIVYDIETADEKLLSGTVSDNETPGVSIGNRISKTITLTSGDAMKLEAGKKYTIQLHLGLSQVEFDATVEDWNDAIAVNGEAWLPSNTPAAVTTPTSLSELRTWINQDPATNAADGTYLGKYVKADGSLADDNSDAIGVVAYYSDAPVDESAPESRILVLAMEDASSSVQWKTSDSGGEIAYDGMESFHGIAFTEAYGDNPDYPAAQVVKNYSVARPSGASIWFFPSMGQWRKMIDGGKTGLTSGAYWLCVEDNTVYARCWHIEDGHWRDFTRKTYYRQVRTVFAY